jgi:hypothetical protein
MAWVIAINGMSGIFGRTWNGCTGFFDLEPFGFGEPKGNVERVLSKIHISKNTNQKISHLIFEKSRIHDAVNSGGELAYCRNSVTLGADKHVPSHRHRIRRRLERQL